jgi:hypothetical protein
MKHPHNALKCLCAALTLLTIPFLANAQDSLNVRKISQLNFWPDGISSVDVYDHYAFVCANDFGVRIIDFSQTIRFREVGVIAGTCNCVRIISHYLLALGGGDSLRIFDIASPLHPLELGSCFVHRHTFSFSVSDTLAYVGSYDDCFYVVNIADPSHPVVASTVYTGWDIFNVAAEGQYAYVTRPYGRLFAYDLSDLNSPVCLDSSEMYRLNAFALAVSQRHVYACDDDGSLHVFDVSDPTHMQRVGLIWIDPASHAGSECYRIASTDTLLLLSAKDLGLFILGVGDPTNPTRVGQWGWLTREALDVKVVNDRAYVAAGHNGFHIVSISNPSTPSTVGFLMTPLSSSCLGVVGSHAYINDSGYGYNNRGNFCTFSLTDPTDARVSGFTIANRGQNMVISDSFAYVASGFNGLVIVDISDSLHPNVVGSALGGSVVIDVDVSNGYAYVINADLNALQILNVNNPRDPQLTGQFNLTEPNNLAVMDTLVYISDYGLRIINVANPHLPEQICALHSVITGAIAAIENRVYLGDYFGHNVYIYDVSDPRNPVSHGSLNTPGIIGRISCVGDITYISDGSAGLRIFNLSNPANPQILGYYDTPGNAVAVEVVGTTAYLLDHTAFEVFDVSQALAIDNVNHAALPGQLTLRPAFPNPFNPTTTISYDLPENKPVRFDMQDILGRRVREWNLGVQTGGSHEMRLDAGGLASGVYFVRLHAGAQSITQKIVLAK